jgi:hypothetical protein
MVVAFYNHMVGVGVEGDGDSRAVDRILAEELLIRMRMLDWEI